MKDRCRVNQAGRYIALAIDGNTYHIGEAKFMLPGEYIDKPPGHYILMVVSEPEEGKTILFKEDMDKAESSEESTHTFEAYSAPHLIDYCRHCVRRKEEH